jgi:hypothetical protein
MRLNALGFTCAAAIVTTAMTCAADGAARPHATGTIRAPQSLAKKQTLLYVAAGPSVNVYSESGQPMGTFATSTGAQDLAMDDAGDVFVGYLEGTKLRIARYAIGGTKPLASYRPTCPSCIGLIQASHQGELVLHYFLPQPGSIPAIDVWDAGKSGKPSRTFHYATMEFCFAVDNAGAVYIPYLDTASGTQRYDEIPAGSSTPSRTIVDSIVPASEVAGFTPYTMTPQTNGNLYVGEWTEAVGDPLAGLYVYPPHGKERRVTDGASNPTATAVDASAKVYVLNSNSAFSSSGPTCDTSHTLSVYSKNATSLLSQATSGFTNGQFMTVAEDGTTFISEFAYFPSQSCTAPQGVGAIALVAPGGSIATTLVANLSNEDLSLYDGSIATNYDSEAMK